MLHVVTQASQRAEREKFEKFVVLKYIRNFSYYNFCPCGRLTITPPKGMYDVPFRVGSFLSDSYGNFFRTASESFSARFGKCFRT